MEILREFFVLLGLEVDGADFDKAEKRVDKLKGYLLGAAAAAGAMGAALLAATRDFAHQAEAIDAWRSKIGGTTEELSALSVAFESIGIEAQDGFEGITDAAEKASDLVLNIKKLAGDAGESFKALGFQSIADLTDGNGRLRNSLDLFKDVVARLAKIENQGERTGIAMRLFGDDVGRRLIPFIDRFGSSIDAATAAAAEFGAIITNEDVEAAREFRAAWGGAVATLRGFGYQIGRAILPQLTAYLMRVTDVVRVHRELIRQNLARALDGIARSVGFALRKAQQYGEAILWITDAVGGLTTALTVLGVALGVTFLANLGAAVVAMKAALAALNLTVGALAAGALKTTLWGLALVALGLILEDVLTTIQGGDSVIARFVQRFDPEGFSPDDWGPVKALRLFVAYIQTAGAAVGAFWDLLFGNDEEKRIASDFLNKAGGRILNIQRSLAKDIAGALTLNPDGLVASGIEGLLGGGTGEVYGRIQNSVQGTFEDLQRFDPSKTEVVQNINARLAQVSRDIAGPSLADRERAQQVTNLGGVSVYVTEPGASAEEIGAAVQSAISDGLRREAP